MSDTINPMGPSRQESFEKTGHKSASPGKKILEMSTSNPGIDLEKDPSHSPLAFTDLFIDRHIGPRPAEVQEMLTFLKLNSLGELIEAVLPKSIRTSRPLNLGSPGTEFNHLARLK